MRDIKTIPPSANYSLLETPSLLEETERAWNNGALFVQHRFHREDEDVRHVQTFSCSVICKTALPIQYFPFGSSTLWIRMEDVKVHLAFDDDIGRAGFGQNMHYNEDLHSTLKDALEKAYADKWVEGVDGTSFVSQDTLSVANEILTSSQSKDRYNEICVSWNDPNDPPPPFCLVVYYSSDTSNDQRIKRYDQAVEDAEFLNTNVSSIAFVDYQTGEFTHASRFGDEFTVEKSKSRKIDQLTRDGENRILEMRQVIEQLKRERDELLRLQHLKI